MSKKEPHTFVYKSENHTMVRWYKDENGDVMAQHTTIHERVPEHGQQPPDFCQFQGTGMVEVDTVMGTVQAKFQFNIPKATTIAEAIEMMDAAEDEVRPSMIQQVKDEAMAEKQKLASQLSLPGRDMPPGFPLSGPKIVT